MSFFINVFTVSKLKRPAGYLKMFGERVKMGTKRKKEWFDDGAFWRELYPFMFPEQRFTQTRDQIEVGFA